MLLNKNKEQFHLQCKSQNKLCNPLQIETDCFATIVYFINFTQPGDSALKTGRLGVPGSIPGHACQLSRSEFSVVFSEISINMG